MNPIRWRGLCGTSRTSHICHQINCDSLALVWRPHQRKALSHQAWCNGVRQLQTLVCLSSKFQEMRASLWFACPISQTMCAKVHSLWIQLCAEEHKGHWCLLHVSNTLVALLPARCGFYSILFQVQQGCRFRWKLRLSVLWGAVNPGLSLLLHSRHQCKIFWDSEEKWQHQTGGHHSRPFILWCNMAVRSLPSVYCFEEIKTVQCGGKLNDF